MDSITPVNSAQKEALVRRYGAASVPAAGPWNDVIATMLDHRSVRGYKPDPVPAGTLETMIAAAQSAATSSNMQWTSVVAITDPEKKKKLAEMGRQPEAHRAVPALPVLGHRHDPQCR